ncbi:MAG: Rrf2 family transcriptional regulator [Gammaproteobacteria bacterium]|nr:Rrf2 family transcriptional regulator [Gammaproteobacteria bacterium]
MQLTLYTDYSLRVLLYLATQSETRATISEIADFHDISRNHLMKVVHNLALAGFVTSQRGKFGGLSLARAAERISIGEVVRQTEPNFHLVECFDSKASNCRIDGACVLKHLLFRASEEFLKTLDLYTLQDMLKPTVTPRKPAIVAKPVVMRSRTGTRSR